MRKGLYKLFYGNYVLKFCN